MQIERTVSGVTTLGPGKRLAVWVNGCFRKCKGCVSPRLRLFNPLNEVDIEEYFSVFDLKNTGGVTISGGEPFEQARELYRLVTYFRVRGIDDILIYTGYTIEELRSKNDEYVDGVLSKIAVLIDGPYVLEKDSGTGNLKGSDNQRIIVLNERYRRKYAGYYRKKRKMRTLAAGNLVLAVGIPDKEFIEKFNL